MDPSLCTLIKLGFLTLPFRFGWKNFLRMNEMLNRGGAKQVPHASANSAAPCALISHMMSVRLRRTDPQREAFGQQADYWTVEAFAIRADARGKGIGTKVLSALVEERVRPTGTTRLVLLTQEEAPHRLVHARVAAV